MSIAHRPLLIGYIKPGLNSRNWKQSSLSSSLDLKIRLLKRCYSKSLSSRVLQESAFKKKPTKTNRNPLSYSSPLMRPLSIPELPSSPGWPASPGLPRISEGRETPGVPGKPGSPTGPGGPRIRNTKWESISQALSRMRWHEQNEWLRSIYWGEQRERNCYFLLFRMGTDSVRTT